MSLVNVTAVGTTLQKSAGCGGCPDAAAVSDNQVSGTGSLEFVVADAGPLRLIGLGSGGVNTAAAGIQFAIRLQAGVAEVRESGAYKAEIAFAAGDTFMIAVDGGSVRYSKNGAAFYTSASQAGYAVRAHAVLFDMHAVVAGISIRGGSGGSSAVAMGAAAVQAAPDTRYAKPRPAGSAPVRRKR